MIEQYGADTVRLFMLFKAPPENDLEWEVRGIQGLFRWLGRLWTMMGNFIKENKNNTILQDNGTEEEKSILVSVHQAIKQVSESFDLKNHTFNVGIAELMKLSNTLGECSDHCKKSLTYYQALRSLTIMMAPMAPHISSEFWEGLISSGPAINNEWAGRSDIPNVLQQVWPKHNESLLAKQEKTVVVSVNKSSFV